MKTAKRSTFGDPPDRCSGFLDGWRWLEGTRSSGSRRTAMTSCSDRSQRIAAAHVESAVHADRNLQGHLGAMTAPGGAGMPGGDRGGGRGQTAVLPDRESVA